MTSGNGIASQGAWALLERLYLAYSLEYERMPYTMADFLRDHYRTLADDLRKVMQKLPVEERGPIEMRLAMIDPKRLLAKMSPEDRMKGIAPEEWLATLEPEERLKVFAMDEILADPPQSEWLRNPAPRERLQDFTPEERVEGLAPEERLKGLSCEELKKLRDYLNTIN